MTIPPYPQAERLDLVEELHGRQVADPYRWLEDPGSESTKAWSSAQDQLFAAQLSGWPGRDRLKARIRELLGAGVVSVPAWRGERRFFMRRTAEQEHTALYTVDPGADTERVLLDPMEIDPSGLTTIDSWQPSKEGDLLAYQLSEGGTERSVLRITDVATGEQVGPAIDRCRYSPIAWLPGGKAFYYVRSLADVPADEADYHKRVWLHRVGTDPVEDTLVFGGGQDPRNYYGVQVSMDGRWLLVSMSTGTAPRNDLWIADITTEPAAPVLREIQVGVDAQTGAHVGRDGRLYLFTDRDAPRNRVCVADPADPAYANWTDLVPQDDEAVLDDFEILDGPELDRPVLLTGWTRHTLSELTVHDLATGERIGEVPLPGLGTLAGISTRPEGGHEAWFGYTDNTTPSTVFRYDAATNTTSVWARPPGSVEAPPVHAQLIEYPSTDGVTVRALLISQQETPDRPRPTVLYGYGGFGLPLTPAYSASVLSWVEAGGNYVIANIRGGGEEGEEWHRDGMLAVKQHSFDDFIAAGQWLVEQGWTTPDQLGISGGSNGGLLVGACLTQRPDLFRAVVCSAPLLDMVRYERFGLGSTWNVEYGSAEDPEQLGWLLGYSPYHRVVEDTRYPAVLFTVFDSDTRVDPLHARKLCAALQYATTGDPTERPVLLRREKDVGHGARAVSRSVELSADTTVFLAAQLGLEL